MEAKGTEAGEEVVMGEVAVAVVAGGREVQEAAAGGLEEEGA